MIRPIFVLSVLALTACGAEDGEISIDASGYEAPSASALDVVDEKRIWEDGCAFLATVPPGQGDEPGTYALPFLTIYGPDGAVFHESGFNLSSSVETWSAALDGELGADADDAPTLEAVLARTVPANPGRRPPEPLSPDATFVRYAADWCAPCKGQSAAIKTFREARPDLKVVHYEVEADMQRWHADGAMRCEAG